MNKTTYALLITLLISLNIQAKTLKIAYYYGPPQSITDKNGKPAGIVNERSRKVLNKLNIKHKFELQPINRIYKELSVGTLDLFNCGLREVDGVLRGKKNIALIDVGLFSKAGTKEYKKLSDVKGKKIVTIRGASMGGATKELGLKNNVLGLTTPVQIFQFVEKGRADYVLVFKKPGKLFLKKLGYKGYKFNSMKKTYCRWMVSKKHPDAQTLLDKLDANTVSVE